MKNLTKTLLALVALLTGTTASMAQSVKVNWEYSDMDNLSAYTISGDEEGASLVSVYYALGSKLSATTTLMKSGADTGYEAVEYDPYFTELVPTAKQSSAATGNGVTFRIAPVAGHKFKPTKLSFDAVKVGTDNGGITIKMAEGAYTESKMAAGTDGSELGSAAPLRNKIMDGNSTGYSHHEYYINDINTEDSLTFILYLINVATDKALGLRNICIEGELDSEILSVGDYISSLSFMGTIGDADATQIELVDLVKDLANGGHACYTTKLSAEPTDFTATLNDAYATDYSVNISYANRVANVSIMKGDNEAMTFSVIFNVTKPIVKGEPVALKRGTMALHSDSGNLVSWRARANDDRNLKFKLYRGSNASEQSEELNDGNVITGKTNFLDVDGTADNYYKLEVLDADGNVIETDVSAQTWDSQTHYIELMDGAPTDPTGLGASYTPNDASFCDMDGDGEYEIILKWSPSNEKDAASSGSTSDEFFDCYKLDGTHLWRIDLGPNFFASAHTTPFIAWDFDGDGFGEFMIKTGPGTIDGQGNYVIMDGDDPLADWKNSKGKQVEGPEYISVFDGATGTELATIPYHTDYAAGESYWGDSNQNRSERYLAGIAWLDGEDANPSPIFARGYYAGAFVGAYDWDGETLSLRWLSENKTKGEGLYGEGAHWMAVGDCDGDGKQDIVYGAATLKSDGTLMYRTGLGHGDALHLGDFDPDNDGLEVFMPHEDSPYGVSLIDAKTGTILWRMTEDSDTGRGLAAHYNPECEGAYFQCAGTKDMFDWNGDVIAEDVQHGGGGSYNIRVYWDGLLSDDYWDKNVLEQYNPTTNSFDRIQVNGTNYTTGELNNSTKYNPCVDGDLLGDWREEIVTWEQDGDTYYLVVNATNYETDYTVPHLMDDANYRAQVINQNCCYNQPPHLSYNLRNSKKITRECIEVESDNYTGKYWDCFYTTYPVIIPDDVTAWKVTDYVNGVDTINTVKLEAGTILAPHTGIIYNSTTPNVTFVPTAVAGDALEGSTICGDYCDTTLGEHSETLGYYEFRDGDRGLGFYLADGETIEGGTGYVVLEGTASDPLASSYTLGSSISDETTGIMEIISDEQTGISNSAIYNLQGIRLNSIPSKGIYIINGKKYLK